MRAVTLVMIGFYTVFLIPLAPAQAPLAEMVRVPAGTFHMGDPSSPVSMPVREITISHDFLMGKYEVTNELFCKAVNYLIDAGVFRADKTAIWNTRTRQYRMSLVDINPFYHQFGVKYAAPYIVPASGRENQPVIGIEWAGAVEICNGLSQMEGLDVVYGNVDTSGNVTCNWDANGYRLPTEAEWEYAARGGDRNTTYPWGDNIDGAVANYKDSNNPFAGKTPSFWNSWRNGGPTTPVGYFNGETHGSFQTRSNASPFGIYDMGGNAYEWCWDVFDRNNGYKGLTLIDPTGPSKNGTRVRRGGDFKSPGNNLWVYTREGTGSAGIGFRLSRSIR